MNEIEGIKIMEDFKSLFEGYYSAFMYVCIFLTL